MEKAVNLMKKNKLKILFISGSYPPAVCGIGDYLQLLAENLSRNHDINVYVLTSSFYNTKKILLPCKSHALYRQLEVVRFKWIIKYHILNIPTYYKYSISNSCI